MRPTGAAGDSVLARCVACGTDVFAEQHWGRAPLLTRAVQLPGAFTDLLDADAVDELVSRRGLRTPFLRMAKEGSVLPAGRFTRGGGAGASITDQAADDQILTQLGDGATLVLQALHRTWPPLVEFGSRLSAELGHPVQINAYITPPQNHGFAPHYDVHDVFVLQVAGRKHWRIHEPVLTDPLADQPWEGRRDLVARRAADDAPLIDTVLEPGDALYLPRGTIHSATALGATSIHLTVGVHPITRHQLVRHLLETAQNDAELRASLPMGVDLADPSVLAPQLAATVEALRRYLYDNTSDGNTSDENTTDAVARRVGRGLRQQTRPEPLAPLAQLAAADALTGTTALRSRIGMRPALTTSGDQLVLTLFDRTVRLAATTADALKTVLSGEPFTAAELPGLDGDEQLALCRRLLRDGVLVPA